MGIRIGFGLRPIGLLLLLHCFDDNSVSGQKVHDDGRSDGYAIGGDPHSTICLNDRPEETNVNVPVIGYIDNE